MHACIGPAMCMAMYRPCMACTGHVWLMAWDMYRACHCIRLAQGIRILDDKAGLDPISSCPAAIQSIKRLEGGGGAGG